jgi:uncharacterized OsmC-like protein
MDADTLRHLQSPLKRRYRDDPPSATTPLTAAATFDDSGITCTVDTWAGPVRAGLHTATGGDGSDACSGDMLLQALIACAGVTLRSVATAMGIEILAATLRADGFFDARGTLAVSRDVPVGVQSIGIIAELETTAADADLTKLAELTERYCVVAQSLAQRPNISITRK